MAPIDYSKWDSLDTDSEPEAAVPSRSVSPTPVASVPKSQARIDYSKWDNIDTDSEAENKPGSITQDDASPKLKHAPVAKRSSSPKIPVDEWTKWEHKDSFSASAGPGPAHTSSPPASTATPSNAQETVTKAANPSGENHGAATFKPGTQSYPKPPLPTPSSAPALAHAPNVAHPLPMTGQFNIMSSAPTLEDPSTMLGVRKPPLCNVCYNLDARHVPHNSGSKESWATNEYNIPRETPAGKITILKSEHLSASAARGCFYCGIVQSVLGQFHPGWEQQECFIYIFVALGLPVILRLQYGQIDTSSLKRDGMNSLGIAAAEGETMALEMEMMLEDKTAGEVEIYRPRLTSDQMSRGDLMLLPLIEHIGVAEEIPLHSGDKKSYEFIRDSIVHCRDKHECEGPGPLPLLPDRVIWIPADDSNKVQLLEPKGIRAQYIALSYCWGPVSADTYLTNASTLKARKSGIQYDDLPPLFQDVITCARVLGIEYIWIDRLCIIQGDDNDFRQQAPKMGDVYGNATFTIAAASATSENDRILLPKDKRWTSGGADIRADAVGKIRLRFRRRSHPLGVEAKGGDYGKVSTRAWIWQERLLSKRTIFYTPSGIKFECRCHSTWEGYGGVTGPSWSAQLDDISHLSWMGLVEEFMGRNITRPSDRLPAMNSVMKRIERIRGWSSLWGLWQDALVESLCWTSKEPSGYTGKHWSRSNPGYYAPSWSWASVDGAVSYSSIRSLKYLTSTDDPMVYDVQVQGVDAARGLITASARVGTVTLNCRIFNFSGKQDPVENDLRYEYSLLGAHSSGEPFPMYPDVALKPWTEYFADGTSMTTPVRVPRGEAPPTTSWTAKCVCLVVGVQRLRCLVLILGGSQRENGCWERVGMVSGLEPGVFARAARHTWRIV